jgi:hypothetical protein
VNVAMQLAQLNTNQTEFALSSLEASFDVAIQDQWNLSDWSAYAVIILRSL